MQEDLLGKYIAEARHAGQSDELIKQELLTKGWSASSLLPFFSKTMEYSVSVIPPADTLVTQPSVTSPSFYQLPVPSSPPTNTDSPTVNESPAGFNWGAFWLTWLWGAAHGYWLALLLIPLTILASLTTVLASFLRMFFGGAVSAYYSWLSFGTVVLLDLGISFWFGRKGNDWAWNKRGTRDIGAFHSRERIWMIVGWIFGVLVLLGWVLFAISLVATKNSTASCAPGVTVEVNGVNQCPQSQNSSGKNSTTKIATTTFAGNGFSFNYDQSWQHKKLFELLEVAQDSGTDLNLFFTVSGLKKVTDKIAAIKNDPGHDLNAGFDLVFAIPTYAEMSVSTFTVKNITSRQQAESATQTKCQGDNTDFSTNNPVDSSRIQTITFANKKAYAVASEVGCNAKDYTIYVDAVGGAILIVGFNNTRTLDGFTPSQKVVLDSFKIQ